MDEKRLRTLEDAIADALRAAQESGELQGAKNYGKPLDLGDGYDETPAELRLAFKALKDAGYAPPEVAMMRELADLRSELQALDAASDEADVLRRKIADLEMRVSMRIERLVSRKL